jgi:predicted nucleic acid-binding protein
MIVVSDTTPLIGLSSIGRLELLRELFDDVYIPQAVFDETVTSGREEGKAKQAVAKANWIHVVEVKDRLAVNILLDEMDLGEIETIVLASELNADWVLMDEKKGRRKLSQLNIPKIGTVGILLKAKQLGLVSNLKPELESLQKSGFSISQLVIEEVLKMAEE